MARMTSLEQTSANGPWGKWPPRLAHIVSTYRLRSADRIGRGPVVTGRPYVLNFGKLLIGDAFWLNSRPAQSHLVVMPGGSIEIGDRVSISYGAAISSQIEVRIADDSKIGPFALIMDSDFHLVGGDPTSTNALLSPVAVGRGAIIGSRVTILRGSYIGDGAIVRSGSVVSGRIADGAVVGGVPARSITESVEEGHDVATVVMRVFGLSNVPNVHDGPAEIPQWDSLGALKLFLALEATFGVELAAEDVMAARSVAGLSDMIESARRKRPA